MLLPCMPIHDSDQISKNMIYPIILYLHTNQYSLFLQWFRLPMCVLAEDAIPTDSDIWWNEAWTNQDGQWGLVGVGAMFLFV